MTRALRPAAVRTKKFYRAKIKTLFKFIYTHT